LRHGFIQDIFDADQIKMVSEELCKPANLNVFMSSKSFEAEANQCEPWYKTQFATEDFGEGLIEKMTGDSATRSNFRLPEENNLIPKNFDVLDEDEILSTSPSLIKEDKDCFVWYKKDDKFGRPKVIVQARVYTNDCDNALTAES